MVETEGISPEERINQYFQYLEDNPELTKYDDSVKAEDKKGPRKRVEIEKKDIFRKTMVSSVRKVEPKYLKVKGERLLKVVRLDSSIPLDLHIYKRERKVDGDHVNNILYFEIKKEGQEANVAEFALRDYGNEFRFSHRKVDPLYRKNGIATFALEAIEEFVRDYSRKVPGREAVIEANAAQLDVLKFFKGNGFETTMDDVPVHGDENEIKIHDLETILASLVNGEEKYKVGPHKYVFPSEYEGPYYQQGKEEISDNVEIDESALVHFRKELDVESGEEERGNVKRWIRSRLGALLRR
mgnify:CR=1 FL=1